MRPAFRKRHSWLLSEKKEVLEFWKDHTINETMDRFGVSRPSLYEWKASEEKIDLAQASKRRRLEGGGCKPSHPDLEESALDFVLSLRNRGQAVNGVIVQAYVEGLAKAKDTVFKPSSGWLTNFKSRNGLSTRRATGFVQKLPDASEARIKQFRELLVKAKQEHKLPDDVTIWNMDETPLYFDMPLATTLEVKGKRQVLVRKALSARKRFTAVFTISSRGDKLPPFLIFQGKRLTVKKESNDIVSVMQTKGFMDAERFKKWVELVVAPTRTKNSPYELILLDSFGTHLNEAALNRLRAIKLIPLLIPGGCTSYLQPLDVSINKPFKDRFRERYRRWMADETLHEFTKSGNMKAARPDEVVDWVRASWSTITPESVAASFLAAGVVPHPSTGLETDEEFLERLRRRWQTKMAASDTSSQKVAEREPNENSP